MTKVFRVTYDEVISLENLCASWEEFRCGKGRKADIETFSRHLGDEMSSLHDDLAGGRYQHGPYVSFSINDPKPRVIHKATVRDRLLHHAIHRQLYPLFAQTFIADSFSCQVGKGTHRAMDRFRQMARQVSLNHTRTCWVLKGDIRKFFASIDHEILMGIVRGRLMDTRLVGLLDKIVRSHESGPGKGLPLGNLTSQLLANIYLDQLDHFVKERIGVKCYVRYADDFVMLSESKRYLNYLLPKLSEFLGSRLALELHPDKVLIRTFTSGVDFLGWVHFPNHRVPRTKTMKRVFTVVNQGAGEQTAASYLGMLSHGNAYKSSEELKNICWLLRF